MLKHGHVRVLKSVHDQHDLGDDENEDENQPDDWWIAVAPESSERVTNILGQSCREAPQADSRFHSKDNVG
jgi:hypothetical protein